MIKELLIATNNPGKVIELKDLLTGTDIRLTTLREMGIEIDVEETGSTFRENAELKAAGYSGISSLPTLADDSGLEVIALDGRPGVFSARYGGEALDFDEKMKLLLDEMKSSGNSDRSARFVCAMSVADAEGKIHFTAEGICNGKIAFETVGNGGFGYDPIFVPDGFKTTFGELEQQIKQKISHRARAIEQIIPFLRHFVAI